ncbi:ABC transporter ATP-binding protein [Xinfangfangia sp. D13-10-4-6]|uniref:ABC transporter ATP-binding protein n=1 Tax=Pseudogemmobacter hezensis TaxID=2737662 RepID=UPI00155814DB|nr:ABC transporter ATP-binding protein [Pseudogemmobacter hezensis]NPD17109.1 ABC transporter ATP-binding protein [Pseudogemmobacter hezensis]
MTTDVTGRKAGGPGGINPPASFAHAAAPTPAAPTPAAPVPAAIELRGISKSFGPVRANEDISFFVPKGTIHGIIGENGAGKSTLMSILYGFYRADQGEIVIHGRPAALPDSQAAIRAGIGMVFQHFKLVQNFTVLENIILGAEDGPRLARSLARARKTLADLSREYELEVDPDALVEDLSVGHQQRVEILKALYRDADILILDEPTGVLTPAEADHLFRILRGLRDQGKTILLITHKLREIMEVTDNVSVMRRGRLIDTVATAKTSPAALAELMVGRKVLLNVGKSPATPGETVLSVENLSLSDEQKVERLRSVSLTLRRGEILGIAGVAGNGQSELLSILGGMTRPGEKVSGHVTMGGQPLPITGKAANGKARREAGIAHVPEDRHHHGLILDFTAWENVALGYDDDPRYGRGMLLDNGALREDAARKMQTWDVRPPIHTLAAKNFSGGNQQKIVLAREIEQDPTVLLIGQPTRGVDIGAIEFIHKQIVALRDQGKAILLVSVELDEIMSLSDRIAVMFDGRIMDILDPAQTDEAAIGSLMAGIHPAEGRPAGETPPATSGEA